MKLAAFYIAALCLLVSCGHPKGLVFRDVETAHINLKDKVPLKLELKITNPNHHAVTIRNAAGHVHINNNYLGRFTVDEGYRVAGGRTVLMPLQLVADVDNDFPAIQKLEGDSSIFLRLDGTITAGKGKVCVTSPIYYEGNEPLEKGEPNVQSRKRRR